MKGEPFSRQVFRDLCGGDVHRYSARRPFLMASMNSEMTVDTPSDGRRAYASSGRLPQLLTTRAQFVWQVVL